MASRACLGINTLGSKGYWKLFVSEVHPGFGILGYRRPSRRLTLGVNLTPWMSWGHWTDCSPGCAQVWAPWTQGQVGEALPGILHLGHIWAMDSLDARKVTVWGTSSFELLILSGYEGWPLSAGNLQDLMLQDIAF